MVQTKKVGPSYVAAVALAAAAFALGGTACSGSPRGGEGDDDQNGSALVVSQDLVISQLYQGGGNTSATYKQDYVEIFNRGSSAVSLNGKSLQYASASGNFSNINNVVALPNVSVDPGKYFLVKLAAGAGTAPDVPSPDHTGNLNLSTAGGKVALVETASALDACGATGSPCLAGAWIDLVGWGTASQSEGSAAPAPGANDKALLRGTGGCADTGTNSVDFTVGAPNPRASGAASNVCSNVPVDSGTGTDTGTVTDAGGTPGLVLLNEVRVNPSGTNDAPNEYAEVLCTPNASLDGYYFVAVEGDGDSASGTPGTADVVVSLAGKTCGANGIVYIKAETGGTAAISAQSTVVTTTSLNAGGASSSPLENATTSFVIIHSPTTAITAGTDYDTNNDGTLDLPGGASVVDGVSVFDQGDAAIDQTYGPRLIVGASPPDGLVRIPGNTTAMSAGAWYFGELPASAGGDTVAFDLTKAASPNFPSDGEMTPGAVNVGTGGVISQDGGTTVDSGTTTDGGTKTDSGTKKDGGATEEEDAGEEETGDDAGTTSGSDAGKKDAGKGTSNTGTTGTTTNPPSSGGCAIDPVSSSGGAMNAIGALLGLSALLRRRRR